LSGDADLPADLVSFLELQSQVWDNPEAALLAIERIRGTGEQLSPPLLADSEVRARLQSGQDLHRAELVAREIVLTRNDASAFLLLGEVLVALGRKEEGDDCARRAAELPNKMITAEVQKMIDDLGFAKKKT